MPLLKTKRYKRRSERCGYDNGYKSKISACIVLQAQSQLKALYKDHDETIIGNCDCTLILGGKERTTLKEISELLGKETINMDNTSENRGREKPLGKARSTSKKYKPMLRNYGKMPTNILSHF